jgi:beta-glucosidase
LLTPSYNWLSDDEHGVRGWMTTYFPDGPGLGASFDKALLHSVGYVVGMEARAQHQYVTSDWGVRETAFNGAGITVYGPNMNLVRDPRWGRSQEVYSEDPRLSSALTVGYVTGVQGAAYNGTQDDPDYMQAAACCKHYVA